MGDVKPWQVALIVVGLLVGAGGILYQCTRGRIELAGTMVLVDVSTGELLEAPLPRNQTVAFPATNPRTGSSSLIPAELDESGAWVVRKRYLPQVQGLGVPIDGIEIATGAIKGSNKDPVRTDVFKKVKP